MISVLFCTINFYYIALSLVKNMICLSSYKSELFLYVVAQNVGFLKWFYGL